MTDTLEFLINNFTWCRMCGKSLPHQDYLCTQGCCVYPWKYDDANIRQKIENTDNLKQWPSTEICEDLHKCMNSCCDCQYGWSDIVQNACYVKHLMSILYLGKKYSDKIELLTNLIDKIGIEMYNKLCEYRKKTFLSGILETRTDILYEHNNRAYINLLRKQKKLDIVDPDVPKKNIFYEGNAYYTKKCLDEQLTNSIEILLTEKRKLERSLFSNEESKLTTDKLNILELQLKPLYTSESILKSGVEGIDWIWYLYKSSPCSTFRTTIVDVYGYYDDKTDSKFTDEENYIVKKFSCGGMYRNSDENFIIHRKPKITNSDYYPIITLDKFMKNIIVFEIDNTKYFPYSDKQYPKLYDNPDFESITGHSLCAESYKY